MRTETVVAIVTLLCFSGIPTRASADVDSKTVAYVLRDNVRHQWCAFQDKDKWTNAYYETRSTVLGYVKDSPEGRVISVREIGASGDWIREDAYLIGETGRVVNLERKRTHFTEKEEIRDIYVRRGNTVVLEKRGLFDLDGHQLPLGRLREFAVSRVYQDVREFPFYALLAPVPSERNAQHCVNDADER